MGLNELIAQQVQSAFEVIDNIPQLGTYTVKNPSTYDPATDVQVSNDTAYSSIKMLKASLTKQEMEASPVTKTTCKFLIASLNLPGVTPKHTDLITYQGQKWEIYNVKAVPGDTLHILFCYLK